MCGTYPASSFAQLRGINLKEVDLGMASTSGRHDFVGVTPSIDEAATLGTMTAKKFQSKERLFDARAQRTMRRILAQEKSLFSSCTASSKHSSPRSVNVTNSCRFSGTDS